MALTHNIEQGIVQYEAENKGLIDKKQLHFVSQLEIYILGLTGDLDFFKVQSRYQSYNLSFEKDMKTEF